jgi:enolase-phosphatase E1
MQDTYRIKAILLDIEGTVAPISFVHEVLFPYARQQLPEYLREHWDASAVVEARRMIDPASAAFAESSWAQLNTIISDLMDRDVKSTGLKQLQGLIWERGYRAGAFVSPVFADVPPALVRWNAAGKTVAIYSSGSVAAQKVFFRHTNFGDLTPHLAGHFDTTTGTKRSPQSYSAIAAALGVPAETVLFLSDVAEEVQAAGTAGMAGLVAVRPGNAEVESETHKKIHIFDEILLD